MSMSSVLAPRALEDLRIEPRLMATALGFLILAAATLLLAAADARTIGDVSVWTKPLKFEASLAIHLGTLALLWRWLPERVRLGRTGGILIAILIVSALYEVVYIAFRGARGEMSHFNHSSALADALYGLMGVGATAIVVATAAAGCFALAARAADDAKPMRLAVGLGLLISGVMGGATGWIIAVRDGAGIGLETGATVPFFGWRLAAGDLRIAHFVGLHAMQGLPLIGFLTRRTDVVTIAACVWIAATLFLAARALNGQGFV